MKVRSLLVLMVSVGLLLALSTTVLGAPWKGTITIWDAPRWRDANDNQYHWMERKIAEFEAANPGVKIEMIKVPWAELAEKLNIAIAARDWPDMAPIDISGGTVKLDHIEQGVLEPIDSFFTKDELADFFPASLEGYTYKGKIWGVPQTMTVHALLLNLEIFRERGVKPPVNGRWTWDEFVDKMKKLTFDRDGDGKIDVYGFSTYVLKGYHEMFPMLFMDGASWFDEGGNWNLNSAKAVSALKKIAALKFEHKVTPQTMGTADVGGTFQAFANPQQRTVAVEPWASWAIATCLTSPKYKTDFMVAEYPIGERGKPITIGGTGGFVVFKQKDKGKLEMLMKFVKTITTTADQIEFAKNYGTFPTRKSAQQAEPFADIPQMAFAAKMMEHAITVPRHKEFLQIDDRLQAELQLVLNGEKTPEKALDDAYQAIKRYLK